MCDKSTLWFLRQLLNSTLSLYVCLQRDCVEQKWKDISRKTFSESDERSIDLNGRVDESCEPKACVETNCSGEDKEYIWDDEHIPEVKDCRDELRDLELSVEVKGGVKKKVNCGRAWCQVRSPPPLIVFTAELKITENDRDLCASDDQNDEDDEEEPKYVVELV